MDIKHILIKGLVFTSLLYLWGCQAAPEDGGLSSRFSDDGRQSAFGQVRDGSTCSAELDLNGPWQFKATDEEEWMEARVPGSVWTDLMRAGRLEDPFYRDNELKVQWIEKKEWEYRRAFQVDEALLNHDRVVLDCRGLDTIAEILVNGTPVAKTENQFIEYEFDVKSMLVVGENHIRIIFRSILEWDRQQVAAEPKVTWTSSKGRMFFTRKEGSDFGWDWGVRLVTAGIWRPIRIAAYQSARITDLAIRQDLSDPGNAILRISAAIEEYGSRKLDVSLKVTLGGEVVAEAQVPVANSQGSATVQIPDPQLWWPNGWGEQPLYVVSATLMDGETEVHRRELPVGLRTVELVREKDQRGETFGFKINGHLIFCKGVNWVPVDALPERPTEEHYRAILAACKEANMNMIRLWGGGEYQPDIFYELCDEYGIMLWHDFMFAVGPFIANEAYLANVEAEITSVVRRLRHHPSIVLWSGNNECESNMGGGQDWIDQYEYVTWEEYDKIFGELIPQTAARYDPDRPYWPSSPHHPLDRDRVNPDWETSSGDAHPWDVWHGAQPFTWYEENLGFRFVSEFGFQSLPDMETIRAFTAPEDRYFPSYVLDHHNKCGRKETLGEGNRRIASYMSTMFLLPPDLEGWVYLSQVMHAEGMKIGSEAYRRNFPHTSGALYWQLNDNWPTISGSSIDYYGRWKALQYFAGRFFNPILVTGKVDGTGIAIWGVNDRLAPVQGALQWTLAGFDGAIVKRDTVDVVLPANRSSLIVKLNFEAEIGEHPEHQTYRKDSYESRSKYYLAYRLVEAGAEISSNVSFFTPQKYLQLTDPHLEYSIGSQDGELAVTVSADRFAAYVALGLDQGYARFSDNFFHLLPGEARVINVVEQEVSNRDFRRYFHVTSLIDFY
ncbi:MAG: glycoside hydrolase family 2 protein [Fidelibacterota bacterium]|nr:MAG: glycoside hydrolase family 2 protein [Candidatus Neomarinimicrobiota bacterium]